MRRASLRHAARVGHVAGGKGMRQLLGFLTLIMAEKTCLGSILHLANALRAYITSWLCRGVGLVPAAARWSSSSAWWVVRMSMSSHAMSDSSSAWSVRMRMAVRVDARPVRDQQPRTEVMWERDISTSSKYSPKTYARIISWQLRKMLPLPSVS